MVVLHERAKAGDVGSLQLAIDSIKNPEALRDAQDNTALHIACQYGRQDAVQLLLSVGFDVNAQNAVGNTPLIIACIGNFSVIASMLLERKAKVNMANDRGNTALHYACFFRFDDMVEMLVQAGAQPFLMNMNSAVPADQTSDEIREFLLDHFARNPQAKQPVSHRTHHEAALVAKCHYISQGGVLFEISHGLIRSSEVKARTRRNITKYGRYLDIEVVIKRPYQQTFSSDDQKRLLRSELEHIRSVSHPNLLPLLGASVDPPHIALVYERVLFDHASPLFPNSGSLRDFLGDPSVALSQKDVMHILRSAASAMTYLHDHKPAICHYNFRTPNVLVGPNLHISITDYGHSQSLFSSVLNTLYIEDPSFVAPEILKNNKIETIPDLKACDVYSFGIFMWEVIVRKTPYNQIRNAMVIGMQVLSNGLRPTIPNYVPKSLSMLMEDCWAEEIEQRPNFAEINDVLNALNF